MTPLSEAKLDWCYSVPARSVLFCVTLHILPARTIGLAVFITTDADQRP